MQQTLPDTLHTQEEKLGEEEKSPRKARSRQRPKNVWRRCRRNPETRKDTDVVPLPCTPAGGHWRNSAPEQG
ncbi:hypothetical protein HPB48_015660 [Haemaphysalis longicornis]|uniref:Uncharacterized protein n=1 Tax=Haemaphysalis longicornis TaxID=44386 RepID=A0A9J6GTW2_HAELO|nr:hypothetical protein HPB48_015660 [Haemaphysalis longicornis]